MTSSKKELLFSLTEKDFQFTYAKGTGPGGQKRNKTSTKVRCFHPLSGAEGISDETRSQPQNKKLAFTKMANSKKFQDWLKVETARVTGQLKAIEEKLDYEMKHCVKVERKKDGKWVVWNPEKDEEIAKE